MNYEEKYNSLKDLILKYFASRDEARSSKLPKDWAVTNGYEKALKKTSDPPKETAQRSLFDVAQ